jgi:serine/threonine-protein kinase
MSVSAGTRLGPYEIVAPRGAGGMGGVYRARDTRLDRAVAIKVLPESVAHDPERLARFQREAKTLAALNHPHIGGIYGVEEAHGVSALVLELVEGPTLAERISRGPIPVDEVLPIVQQICDALEAAHDQGIIHRDLKPANIKLRPDGTVKVLDFGLAKVLDPYDDGTGTPSLTRAPTLTSPAMVTSAGMLLGTAAYMSPEQAKGRPADKRSDLWAFGCVLYEMLTGKRAFEAEDVGETLASILRSEPIWTLLPTGMPIAVERLLRRCLEKDRKRRLADAADARLEIDDALSEPLSPDRSLTNAGSPAGRWRSTAVAIAALVVGAAVAAGAVWTATRPDPPRVTRLTIASITPTAAITGSNSIAITPDGSRVVYRGSNGGLLMRQMDQLEPIVLTSSGLPAAPFVSPDGRSVAFFEGVTLKRVAITGGPAVTVAENTRGGGSVSGTWGRDDTIVFATTERAGLQRVPAAGGRPEALTTPDEARGELGHSWPRFLPDGKHLLFTIARRSEGRLENDIALLDMETGTTTLLVRDGSHARYVATGHLVYGIGGTLRAVRFDPRRRAVVGTAVPVVAPVASGANGSYEFELADDGTLVYRPGGGDVMTLRRTLVWVDRHGRETALDDHPRSYVHPRVAPDGTRVAVFRGDEERDLWIWDLARAALTRTTYDPAIDTVPLWTPDSRRLIFSSSRAGASNLYMQAADGSGTASRLTDSPNNQQPTGMTPDGRQVVFYETTAARQRDIKILTLTAAAQPVPLIETRFDERGGIVSPDGRWLAYESNSSGDYEIYVRPFPAVNDGLWPVSTAGGTQPLWEPNGRALFYIAPDGALMMVALNARAPAWSSAPPVRLFAGRYFRGGPGTTVRQYDITADGQRFLMMRDESRSGDANQSNPIVVVQNWDEELKRLLPAR